MSDSSHWLASLAERGPPRFNQLVVWLLLGCCALLAFWPYEVHTGPRQAPVTLLSWLPAAALTSKWTLLLFRALLVIGAALWAGNRALPYSCWLTTVGFTGVWSLHVENTHNTAHIYNLPNMLLVIQSLWITADAPRIRQALAAGTYWQTPLVPRWVSLASLAYIGLFHTAAGLSKLLFSGPGWANGTSLQLWAYVFGYEWSPTRTLMIHSRTLTAGLQIATLVVETAGILAIFPRLRPWIGLALVGFYGGVLVTFPYGFALNAVFTAVYLLPFERWLTPRGS
ncbi:MAG: hypothetical protein SFU86_20995 [Pirellulaceae bacterium]|nr:hypothetical protein [Pirellulaceae bacterium]